jgi:hypothetical protein
MNDRNRWEIAWTIFQAYMRNLPHNFTEERIKQYHAHVIELELASGLFLNDFKIPPAEIKQKQTTGPGFYGGPTTRVAFSRTKYCDTNYATTKITALHRYLLTWTLENRKGQPLSENKDYWSMSDKDIEYLGHKYHMQTEKGGYLDRTGIIDALVKRDNVLNPASPQPGNSIQIGQMVGSAIQQASPGAVIHHNFQQNDADLLGLVAQIKEFQVNGKLSHLAASELAADVSTIEAQIASPHPKATVITELLRSARSILESAAGSIVAPHIIAEIAKYLGGS